MTSVGLHLARSGVSLLHPNETVSPSAGIQPHLFARPAQSISLRLPAGSFSDREGSFKRRKKEERKKEKNT